MMFGSRENFTYVECGACGSLYIAQIPSDLSRHYPESYYSFKPPLTKKTRISALRKRWGNWLLTSRTSVAEAVVQALAGKYAFFLWARLAGVRLDAAILDVGCGNGGLLRRMRRYGFSNLSGADPYTSTEVNEPGLRIKRAELGGLTDKFDFIMMHHVLEHLVDARADLIAARELLRQSGKILVRIPVAGSEAARLYREHWFNLDPPRHLVVPSQAGMTALAERSGLRIVYSGYDSTEAGYWMSENYRRNFAFVDRPHCSATEQKVYQRRAVAANKRGDGDLGVFVLEPQAD